MISIKRIYNEAVVSGLKSKTILDLDNTIYSIDQNFPNSNYGGCGIIAKLLYYALKKYFNYTPEIKLLIVGNSHHIPTTDEIENCPMLACNMDDPWEWRASHVVVMVNKRICMDSEGLHRINELAEDYRAYHISPVSIETLRRWVDTASSWNPTFNRRFIPNIAKFIDNLMNRIKRAQSAKK